MNIVNPILANDSYKLSHKAQLPGVCTQIYSHLTPRFLKYLKQKFPTIDDKVIVYGIQMTIQILKERWDIGFFNRPWAEVEIETLNVLTPMLGLTDKDITHFKALHELGYLPLSFKALPEGSHVNVNIPVLTVTNTHPDFYWLTNFLEPSILNTIFKPMTVATLTLELAKLRNRFFNETSDLAGQDFALHDFSYRGQSGHESAAETVSAYLLYTKGTDTMAAVQAARYYYDACPDIAGSINAFEHSTATTGIQYFKDILQVYEQLGSDEVALATFYNLQVRTVNLGLKAVNEVLSKMEEVPFNQKLLAVGETFNLVRVLLEVYPTGFFAYVGDSYNYQRLISIIIPALKDIILSRDGKFVIRPDSGNPVDIVCGSLNSSSVTKLCDDVPEDLIVDQIKNILTDMVSESTPHGERGPDEFEGIFLVRGQYFKGKIYNIFWNRYDKQYYYIDGYSSIKCSVELIELTSEQKGSIETLADTFGTTINSKGFKELPPQIGLVYGDGMNYQRILDIYQGLKDKGFAASNVVLSGGAYMLANLTRDDLGFAIKASNAVIDGKSVPVFKEPATDMSKASAKGLFKVVQHDDGNYQLLDNVTEQQEKEGLLQEVWRDGLFITRTSFEEIKERLSLLCN